MKRSLAIVLVVAACSSKKDDGASLADAGADAGVRQGDANDWSCLGKVVLPALPLVTAKVTFKISDATMHPSTEATVRACPVREDEKCANGTATAPTDAKGEATFDVPADFDGYWEAIEPSITDLHFVPFRQYRSPDFQWRTQWHFDELRILSDTIDLKFDTTRGHVLILVRDCGFTGLPGKEIPPGTFSPPESLGGGVTLGLDPMPSGVVLAYIQAEPNLRIRTDLDETQDGAGGGGFFNVPPGAYTVTGIRKSTGEKVGTQRIHVRADSFSLLLVVPTP